MWLHLCPEWFSVFFNFFQLKLFTLFRSRQWQIKVSSCKVYLSFYYSVLKEYSVSRVSSVSCTFSVSCASSVCVPASCAFSMSSYFCVLSTSSFVHSLYVLCILCHGLVHSLSGLVHSLHLVHSYLCSLCICTSLCLVRPLLSLFRIHFTSCEHMTHSVSSALYCLSEMMQPPDTLEATGQLQITLFLDQVHRYICGRLELVNWSHFRTSVINLYFNNVAVCMAYQECYCFL